MATEKRAGRPVTVDVGDVISLRLPVRLQDALDAFASGQGMTRAEAIRQILEEGLPAVPLKPPKKKSEPWIESAVKRAEERSRRTKARPR